MLTYRHTVQHSTAAKKDEIIILKPFLSFLSAELPDDDDDDDVSSQPSGPP
jgi:hypothetical protein